MKQYTNKNYNKIVQDDVEADHSFSYETTYFRLIARQNENKLYNKGYNPEWPFWGDSMYRVTSFKFKKRKSNGQ